jgi:hypothetical protein
MRCWGVESTDAITAVALVRDRIKEGGAVTMHFTKNEDLVLDVEDIGYVIGRKDVMLFFRYLGNLCPQL